MFIIKKTSIGYYQMRSSWMGDWKQIIGIRTLIRIVYLLFIIHYNSEGTVCL